MKTRLKLFTILLLISTLSWGQTDSQSVTGNNELKLNALTTIGGYFEASYERILNEESSVGLSVGTSIDKSFDVDFAVFPYYRFFFGEKRASGFFIEANTLILSHGKEEYFSEDRNKLDFGAGIAVGGKFISTKSGFVGELFVGAGRTLTGDFFIDVYPRIGISIGKRF